MGEFDSMRVFDINRVVSAPEPFVLKNCHDCAVEPGQPHIAGCDVERCSVCGEQRIACGCSAKKHDRAFARWTGIWPGSAECHALGIDLNAFYERGLTGVPVMRWEKNNEN